LALVLDHRPNDRRHRRLGHAVNLAGRTPADLRPVLRFWDLVSYPAWAQLEPVLRGRWAPQQLSPRLREVFSAGVEALTAGPCAGTGSGL